MQTLGIIPARYASTRFPGKPLVQIAGKTMIQRVYEQASKAQLLSKVVVATDDERIMQAVQNFNGQAIMTRSDHQSGTDRCAEVANYFQDIEAVVNIQGDEPFIDPFQIDLVIRRLQDPTVTLATLVKKLEHQEDLEHPNIVKVVFNEQQEALYFSRSPIPFVRGIPPKKWLEKAAFYQHIGIYGYKRATLVEIAQLPKGRLELLESLEQLRWLEYQYTISVTITDKATFGIDTPKDLEKAIAFLEKGNR